MASSGPSWTLPANPMLVWQENRRKEILYLIDKKINEKKNITEKQNRKNNAKYNEKTRGKQTVAQLKKKDYKGKFKEKCIITQKKIL